MKLSDFVLLNEEEKKLVVLHQGVLVAKRKHHNNLVFLFHFDNYYVETYCRLDNHAIEEYKAFTNLALLDPYLETIELNDLLNECLS